jgi:hypothetical protein
MLTSFARAGIVRVRTPVIKRFYYNKAESNPKVLEKIDGLSKKSPLFKRLHEIIGDSKRSYIAKYAEGPTNHSSFNKDARTVTILNAAASAYHYYHEWAHMVSFDSMANNCSEETAVQYLDKPAVRLADEYFAYFVQNVSEGGSPEYAAKVAAEMIPIYVKAYGYTDKDIKKFKEMYNVSPKIFSGQREIIKSVGGLEIADNEIAKIPILIEVSAR